MCILDYVVIRFDPEIAWGWVMNYKTLSETKYLKDEILSTVCAALDNPDCGQVVVIEVRTVQHLRTLRLLNDYIPRGAKFLCLAETQEDRDLVIWLNDELERFNSPSRIYIAQAPEPQPQLLHRNRDTLQVVGRAKRALPAPLVKVVAPIGEDYVPNKPWYEKHSKKR